MGFQSTPIGTPPLRRFSVCDQCGRADCSRVPVQRLFTCNPKRENSEPRLRPHWGISQDKLPLYLGFFQFAHNARRRGKALLDACIAGLVA